jgi:DNA-binding IclR family transcriptional regulator
MILNRFQCLIQLIHLTFQILDNRIYAIALAHLRELALRTEELADFGVDCVAPEELDPFVLEFD